MPEIDETELANLRRVAAVADKISKHPEARGLLQKAISVAVPDEAGPEIRMRAELDEFKTSLLTELKTDREAREKKDAEETTARQQGDNQKRWNSGREYARNSGYLDDGLTKLEEYMEREGIFNHKHAIAAFERENPPAPPPITGGSGFNWFQQADQANDTALKALYEGRDEDFLGSMIPQAIAESRNQR